MIGRQLVRHADRPQSASARVIALLGGKGGIGKSNLAVNIGVALSRRGWRVVVLDGAACFPHLPMMLADASAELIARRDLDEAGLCGLRLCRCGPLTVAYRGPPESSDSSAAASTDWRTVVNRLGRLSDVTVIDCGSGQSGEVFELALLADFAVLATTPDPIALTNAYATAKALVRHDFRGSVGLVINMVRSAAQGRRVARRIIQTSERFLGLSVRHLGSVPFDGHVVSAGLDRRPVLLRFPRCAASACIERISGRLAPARAASRPDGNLWLRVASLFL